MMPLKSGQRTDSMGNWRESFIKQSHSDYEAFVILNQAAVPVCHCLHYLQMLTEKLAKGFLCADDPGGPPRAVHAAFVRFLQVIKSNRKLQAACRSNPAQFKAFIDSLLPLAREIESLAPSGSFQKPNPEYPWELNNKVITPAEYDYPSLDFKSPRMVKMLRLIEICYQVLN